MNGRLYWDDSNSIQTIGKLLAEGNLVAGTTDTVIGLFAPATQQGKALLDAAKVRNEKPYLILADDIKRVLQYVHPDQRSLLAKIGAICWPGPVTLIAKATPDIPRYFVSADNTVGFRVPLHPGMQALLQESGLLFSTSANISGEPIPESVGQINPAISKAVSAVIENSGENSRRDKNNALPSTIIDCSHDPVRIIRAGNFDLTLLNPILGYTPR
jgi:L-threonylcarbamoyladenylate synthase